MIKIRQGIDITSVHRLKEIIQRQGRRFTNRVFTPAERNYCESQRMKYENYASRFAAKEAAMKAFEVPKKHRYRFREIGIRRHPTGKPYFHLSRISKKRFNIPPDAQIEVSMSHERDYAIATVVMIIPSR